MNDTTITVCGNVVDEPHRRELAGGHEVVNFRIASTPRRFDRKQGCFIDNPTLFITVSAWRQLGRNVQDSLHKGQPVVVTGRLTMRQWTVDQQPRSAYDLEAVSVGHDLSRGTTKFSRVYPNAQIVTVNHDANGMPLDESDNFYDTAAFEPAPDGGTSLELGSVAAVRDEREPALAAG